MYLIFCVVHQVFCSKLGFHIHIQLLLLYNYIKQLNAKKYKINFISNYTISNKFFIFNNINFNKKLYFELYILEYKLS